MTLAETYNSNQGIMYMLSEKGHETRVPMKRLHNKQCQEILKWCSCPHPCLYKPDNSPSLEVLNRMYELQSFNHTAINKISSICCPLSLACLYIEAWKCKFFLSLSPLQKQLLSTRYFRTSEDPQDDFTFSVKEACHHSILINLF